MPNKKTLLELLTGDCDAKNYLDTPYNPEIENIYDYKVKNIYNYKNENIYNYEAENIYSCEIDEEDIFDFIIKS